MVKRKILLVISVLVVLSGSLTALIFYKDYSDKQNMTYINSKFTEIQTDLNTNNLTGANAAIVDVKSRINTNQNPKLEKKLNALTTQLIQKQNENKAKADLTNIASLIQKGSLTEASFEIEKLDGEQLSDADKVTLAKDKDLLATAKSNQTNANIEKNSMNTLNNFMSEGKYENANNYIENLDTTGFSKASLDQITAYTKQIQNYENKFNINDFKVPSSQIIGLYQEAFPSSTYKATVLGDTPVLFIGNTPIYKVSTTSPATPIVYLLADGTNASQAVLTTALRNNNLFVITSGKKAIASDVPSDAK